MIEYPLITPLLWFQTLEDALAPLKAGMSYKSCKDCTNSGGEMIPVDQPHAIYTNLYGKAIIQLDTVVLGGVNGVNN